MSSFLTAGIRTGIIRPGDDVAGALITGIAGSDAGSFRDGDILVIAETVVATAEGAVVDLASVVPGDEAVRTGERYGMDPRVAEIVLRESDTVVGGIPGFLLCMKGGTLLPNAGIDASNAPPGTVVLLPADPDASARRIRMEIEERTGARIGVIIADSRTHAMRAGCSGVAIGCSGFPAVIDIRGRSDLFGRTLEVTKQALADNIASAAEIVMGEADECTPAAVLRGLGIPIGDYEGIESIDADECLFMGLLRRHGE
ncbi:MAG: coenzyme F420-0:L-glutamate ligase [Methanomicrobiales archaeon]|nr:coenzyme F420-0:L-glutamate ligase [Methanomicrobiales archaeon]